MHTNVHMSCDCTCVWGGFHVIFLKQLYAEMSVKTSLGVWELKDLWVVCPALCSLQPAELTTRWVGNGLTFLEIAAEGCC